MSIEMCALLVVAGVCLALMVFIVFVVKSLSSGTEKLFDNLTTTAHRNDQQLRAFGDRMLLKSEEVSRIMLAEIEAESESPAKPQTRQPNYTQPGPPPEHSFTLETLPELPDHQ